MIQLDSETTKIKIKILEHLHNQKLQFDKKKATKKYLNRSQLRTKLKLDNDEGKLHQPVNELYAQGFITQCDIEPYYHEITTDGEAVWRFLNP